MEMNFKIKTYLISKDFNIKTKKEFRNKEDRYAYITNNFDYISNNNSLLKSITIDEAINALSQNIIDGIEPDIVVKIILFSSKDNKKLDETFMPYKALLECYEHLNKEYISSNISKEEIKHDIAIILSEEEYTKAGQKFTEIKDDAKKRRHENEMKNVSYNGYDISKLTVQALKADKPFTALDTMLLLRNQIMIGVRNMLSEKDINAILKALFNSGDTVNDTIDKMIENLLKDMPKPENYFDSNCIAKIICLLVALQCELGKYKAYLDATDQDFYNLKALKNRKINKDKSADEIAEEILNEVKHNEK